MRRVVVTGLGAVAPNGVGKEAFWSSCTAGRSGIGPIRSFDASAHPVRIAGEVSGFDVTPFLPPEQRKSLKIMGRAMRFAVGAAVMAVQDSGLDLESELPHRVGVFMGTGLVPMDLGELAPLLAGPATRTAGWSRTHLGQQGSSALFPLWILKYLPNMVATHISLALGAQGPNSTITTACVAGTQAVGEAFRLIARDDADVVLAGGADSRIDPLLMLAYLALGALSRADRSASRGVAAVRSPARRLRPRRGGRRPGAGRTGTCEEARRHHLCGSARLRQQFRRLFRHQAGPGGARSGTGDRVRAARGEGRCRRRGLHQRPRHQHAPQRPDGNGGGQTCVRRGSAARADVVDQVDGRAT